MGNDCFKSERLLYRPYQMGDVQSLVDLRNEESRRKWFYFQEPDILMQECAVKHIKENIALNAELKIVGKPEPANIPSCKVLEKAGFAFFRSEEYLSVLKYWDRGTGYGKHCQTDRTGSI